MEKIRRINPGTRKLFMETMSVLIISEMADALCGAIDAMYVGKFLGSEAIAALGVSVPVFTFLCIFSYMLAAGIQHSCTKSIGSGNKEEANGYFNLAILTVLVLAAVLTVTGMMFPRWTATMLGAGEGPILPLAADYLKGIAPGTAPLLLFLVMVPILQIDGKWALIHTGSIVMAVSDVAFDYINIHFLHGGMFGMGLSTSISYTLGLGVFLFYFADKNRIFRLSAEAIKNLSFGQFFRTGIPVGVRTTARMSALVFINVLVVNMAGADAMAAIAVQRNVSSVVLSAVMGLCGAVLTLTSGFYGKRDHDGIRDTLTLGFRHSFGIVAIFATLLFFSAPLIVSLYIDRDTQAFPMAVKALRWLSASMPPMAWNWSFASFLHGVGRIGDSTKLFISGELVALCITASILGLAWGADGIFASFAVSQGIILVYLYFTRSKFFLPLRK